MPQRTPAEIRNSIQQNRMELAVSVERLRGEVTQLIDWRTHLERHREELMIGGAAIVSLMLGRSLLRRRRRRRSS